MKILVENSGYNHHNAGDVAMLAAAVKTVSELRPDAHFLIFSNETDRSLVSRYCSQVSFDLIEPTGRLFYASPVRAIRWAGRFLDHRRRLSRLLQMRFPASTLRMATALEGSGGAGTAGNSIRQLVSDADLVLFSGGGYLCESFPEAIDRCLAVAFLASAYGKPLILSGQGIGPFKSEDAIRDARFIVSRAARVGIRDFGELLEPLGLENAPRVNGDDAFLILEAPVGEAPDQAEKRLGVNLRLAAYSSTTSPDYPKLASQIREFARNQGFSLQSVPIADYPDAENDLDAYRSLFGDDREFDPDAYRTGGRIDFRKVQSAAASCEVVVSMSYHACIFALAGGRPCIGVTGSSYYDGKFGGLKRFFPNDFRMVRIENSSFNPPLDAAYAELLERAADRAARIRQITEQIRRSSRAFLSDAISQAGRCDHDSGEIQ